MEINPLVHRQPIKNQFPVQTSWKLNAVMILHPYTSNFVFGFTLEPTYIHIPGDGNYYVYRIWLKLAQNLEKTKLY